MSKKCISCDEFLKDNARKESCKKCRRKKVNKKYSEKNKLKIAAYKKEYYREYHKRNYIPKLRNCLKCNKDLKGTYPRTRECLTCRLMKKNKVLG